MSNTFNLVLNYGPYGRPPYTLIIWSVDVWAPGKFWCGFWRVLTFLPQHLYWCLGYFLLTQAIHVGGVTLTSFFGIILFLTKCFMYDTGKCFTLLWYCNHSCWSFVISSCTPSILEPIMFGEGVFPSCENW